MTSWEVLVLHPLFAARAHVSAGPSSPLLWSLVFPAGFGHPGELPPRVQVSGAEGLANYLSRAFRAGLGRLGRTPESAGRGLFARLGHELPLARGVPHPRRSRDTTPPLGGGSMISPAPSPSPSVREAAPMPGGRGLGLMRRLSHRVRSYQH